MASRFGLWEVGSCTLLEDLEPGHLLALRQAAVDGVPGPAIVR